ncbi:MAG: carbon monoxide dehydrogenase subunit G [Acidobacteriota bacterium]|nr:carbon monoxide dehydrogenase subunit G [Acidobacteriota bacterium]MDE2962363.1 carbon monoxide dehydrogenase subunit G [Acidobacteriota bacterium]
MKISGSRLLALDQERCYRALQDPSVLERCMPGCRSLVKVGEDTYAMKMKMALASISGLFDGKVRIADRNFPHSFRLLVEGSGRIGFLKGDGLLQLTPENGGTSVGYEGEVRVGGTISAVGQRLLDTTSKMMIKRFFDKLTESLTSSQQ